MSKLKETFLRLTAFAICALAAARVALGVYRGYIIEFRTNKLVYLSDEPGDFYFEILSGICVLILFGSFLVVSYFDKKLAGWVLARRNQKRS